MSLENLPEELLAIILKLLDLKTIYSLYDVGIPHIQNVIASGFIKNCDISLSTMATIEMLNSNFFMNISEHLTSLDLKGVQDLTREALIPAAKRLQNLSTLNVSYTNITIVDFVQIYSQCPTIINISIDYQFTNNEDADFTPEMVLKYQQVFANMKKVHFVGSKHNLLESHLPELLLKHASLDSLTYSMVKNHENITYMAYQKYIDSEPIIFRNLNIFSGWRDSCGMDSTLNGYLPTPILKNIFQYEFIVVCDHQFKTVQCSPIFKTFLEHNFGQKAKVREELDPYYDPVFTQACFIWDKHTTTFDKIFFDNLLTKIAPLFPCKLYRDEDLEEGFDSDDDETVLTSDWIWVRYDETQCSDVKFPAPKKKKTTPQFHLDYDTLLKDKQNVELNIKFNNNVVTKPWIAVTIPDKSNFIEKLTYLSLEIRSNYNLNFFHELFPRAKKLKTLNLELDCSGRESRYTLPQLLKHIKESPSLNNLRISAVDLFDKKIKTEDYINIECKTLENIFLSDVSFKVVQHIGKPELLIKHCKNLYHLRIEVFINDSYKTSILKLLNKAKKLYSGPHLNIEINSMRKDRRYHFDKRYEFDPYIDVFKLSKVKIINM